MDGQQQDSLTTSSQPSNSQLNNSKPDEQQAANITTFCQPNNSMKTGSSIMSVLIALYVDFYSNLTFCCSIKKHNFYSQQQKETG
jgi:hypothetical protein